MGAGFHGGFGNTLRKVAHKIGEILKEYRNYSKADIVLELNDITDDSTAIAQGILNKEIGINIVSGHVLEYYLGVKSGTIAIQKGNQIYVRKDSASLISDIVHEGKHVLDYNNSIPQKKIGSHWGELRAYLSEHNFQKKTGRKLDFKNADEIKVHVHLNYTK